MDELMIRIYKECGWEDKLESGSPTWKVVQKVALANSIVETIERTIAQAKLYYLVFLCEKYEQKGGVWIRNLDYVHEFAVLEKQFKELKDTYPPKAKGEQK